ncbi:MAG: HAMP domain-containing protein, partial [Deltaproteobacteria bacterium]
SANGITNRIEPRNSDDPLTRVMGGMQSTTSKSVQRVQLGEKEFNINVTNFSHQLGLSWKIISAVPSEKYLGPLTQKLVHLYFIIGLLLLFSLLCSYWMGRRLVKPLVYLNQAVNDFSQGLLFTFKPLKRKDEIGQLTTSFANMVEENIKLRTCKIIT